MLKVNVITLLLSFSFLSSSATYAEIYKWVDENGKVHFGDAPPSSKEAQSVNLKPVNSFSGNQPKKPASSTVNQQQLMQRFQKGMNRQKAGFNNHIADGVDKLNDRLQTPEGLDKYENKDKTKIDEIKHNLRNGSRIKR